MAKRDPLDAMKQRALESLEMARAASERTRRDWQELSDGWTSIATRVVQTGRYPHDKMLADALTMALHGYALWASCCHGPIVVPPIVVPPKVPEPAPVNPPTSVTPPPTPPPKPTPPDKPTTVFVGSWAERQRK